MKKYMKKRYVLLILIIKLFNCFDSNTIHLSHIDRISYHMSQYGSGDSGKMLYYIPIENEDDMQDIEQCFHNKFLYSEYFVDSWYLHNIPGFIFTSQLDEDIYFEIINNGKAYHFRPPVLIGDTEIYEVGSLDFIYVKEYDAFIALNEEETNILKKIMAKYITREDDFVSKPR